MTEKRKGEGANKTAVDILEARIVSLSKKLDDKVAVTYATKARYEELVGLLKELKSHAVSDDEVHPIKERIAALLEENQKAAQEATALAERISELRDMLEILSPEDERAEEG